MSKAKARSAKASPSKGIQELVWVDPKTLDQHPMNWKRHPQSQKAALRASIQTDGWTGALLYNRRTKRLLDGHGRREEALANGWDRVPVLVGDWDEDTEMRILQRHDTIGGMYLTDTEKLSSLNSLVAQSQNFLAKAASDTRKTLEALQSRITALPEAIVDGRFSSSPLPLTMIGSSPRKKPAVEPEEVGEGSQDDASESVDPTVTQEILSEDTIFPSSNPWGLPDWDYERLAPAEAAPSLVYTRLRESVTPETYYCHSCRPFRLREEMGIGGGVLGFFCEDYRFEAAYFQAIKFYQENLASMGWAGVCCPDYSTYQQWPYAMNLWQVYRSLWVSRFWQSLELPVIPTLRSVFMPRTDEVDAFLQKTWGETGAKIPRLTPQGKAVKPKVVDIGMVTMPVKAPLIATQCRTIKHQGGDFRSFAYWLAERIEFLQPQVVVIYGGGEHVGKFLGYLPKQHAKLRYVMLKSFQAERRGWAEKLKREAALGTK